MWQAAMWETEEDVERSIVLMAEYCTPTQKEIEELRKKVPQSILNYRKQMAANKQKTLNSDIDESASYIVSGRGRGIRDRVLHPGGIVDCHPSDETELRKQIRQVAGFGYSNELIEKAIKAQTYDPEENNNPSSIRFVSSPSSSSPKASVENSPKKKKNAITGSSNYNGDKI